ncbi:MAG: leucyl aminopeptidase [bacterium]|nr:leucyl aminopeptidase [Candidatus Sumerlaeota bacterium]
MKFQTVTKHFANLRTPLLAAIIDPDDPLFCEEDFPLPRELARLKKLAAQKKLECGLYTARGADESGGGVYFLPIAAVKHFTGEERLRILAAQCLGEARERKAAKVTFALNAPAGALWASAIIEGCMLADYRFDKYKSKDTQPEPEITVELLVDSAGERAAKTALPRLKIMHNAVCFCRDLVNEPASVIYPETLARAASKAAKASGLACEILDDKAIVRKGYMGIHAVGKGSRHKPRLIIMRYIPKTGSSRQHHLALVGKAVTFDTGGICLKPPKDMWEMKGDMAGGAAVIAAMTAIARLKPRLRVTGIVPCVENAVGNDSGLPGDIIRTKTGKTIMVENTDAEGRLILIDGLIRAKEEGATHAVDIATLTGAVVRALGTSIAGILGNDQDLISRVIECGKKAGEEYWQLPLWAEYRDMLKNDVADIANSSGQPNAGAITGALFINEFVDPSIKWAHLDIAGTSLITKKWKYFSPGATGTGVRTLAELAEDLAV